MRFKLTNNSEYFSIQYYELYFSSYFPSSDQVIFDTLKCFRKRTEQCVSIGIKFNHERATERDISTREKEITHYLRKKKATQTTDTAKMVEAERGRSKSF